MALKKYFYFYNYERPHSALGRKSLAEIYFQVEELPAAA
jgi:transposase InsO family protein